MPALQKAAEQAGLKKVTAVVLDVGMLHNVSEEFLAHSFEHAFEGTVFQGAVVKINIIEPGRQIDPTVDEPAKQATGFELIIRRLEGEEH